MASPTLRFVSALIATLALAQAQQSYTDRMNANFDRRDPRVGAVLPDVAGVLSDGKPFSLAEDRGHLTVLVFGCLT